MHFSGPRHRDTQFILLISQKAGPATQGLARWCAIPLGRVGESRVGHGGGEVATRTASVW